MTGSKFKICSRVECSATARKNQRYCDEHHAEYMRGWRKREKSKKTKLMEENRELKERLRELQGTGNTVR